MQEKTHIILKNNYKMQPDWPKVTMFHRIQEKNHYFEEQ